MSRVRLKYLARRIARGAAPTYADGDIGDAYALGQSCVGLGGKLNFARVRPHVGAPPERGRLEMGDIVITSTGHGTIGRSGRVGRIELDDGGPVFADGHLTIVRADPARADSRFIAYQLGLPSFRHRAERALAVGATKQLELAPTLVSNEMVWCLGLVEQRRIADFLDRESARVEALADRLRRVRGWGDAWIAARSAELARNVADEDRPLRSLVDPARPIMYGIVLPGEDLPFGVPLVKGGHVERGALTLEGVARVADSIERAYARSRLRSGDVLVTIRGSFGAVGVVPPELAGGNITQDTARVAPAPGVESELLAMTLRLPGVQRQIHERVRGTGVKGLNIWDLKRLRVPWAREPHRRERLESELRGIAQSAQSLGSSAERMRASLWEYRDALTAEAITGQLDVSRFSDAQMEESLLAASEGERPEVLSS